MFVWKRKKKQRQHETNKIAPDQTLEKYQEEQLSGNLEEAISFIQQLLGENDDFVIRRFQLFGEYPAVMFYFSNLINQARIDIDILKALMYGPSHVQGRTFSKSQLPDIILNEVLYHSEATLEKNIALLTEALMRGETVVVVEGLTEAFQIGTRNVEKRAIAEPKTEQVILGPREGFIERLGTNIALLRYRLQTTSFRVKTMKIGRVTKTKVAICYLEGTVNPDLVQEVQHRLSLIDIDAVLDIGYLEQFIEDHRSTPFPQALRSERPDTTVANILEGRVAILVDGSPFALIVPVVFHTHYQTAEDYTSRMLEGNFIRLFRILAMLFSLIFPSLYISIISFNPELIPTQFAVAVAGGRAGVPFPAVIEVLIIEMSMEVLREATVRLPQQVGGALSIVGVLVIGQAAVEAGFVSPITVVIIALTTIGSFAIPNFSAAFAFRMLRFPLIILAGIFGLYGVVLGLILITNHMLSLRSFGVPFMSPVVPGNFQGMKDTVLLFPVWGLTKKPAQLHPGNRTRLGRETEEVKNAPRNTLDELKVGNKRLEED